MDNCFTFLKLVYRYSLPLAVYRYWSLTVEVNFICFYSHFDINKSHGKKWKNTFIDSS